MNGQRIRPGRGWYAVAAVILAIGIGAMVWGVRDLVANVKDAEGFLPADDTAIRVEGPGESRVELSQAGEYWIARERRKRIDELGEPAPRFFSVQLAHTATGRAVDVEPLGYDMNYEFGALAGKGLYRFRIDEPGTYTVTISEPEVTLGVEEGSHDTGESAPDETASETASPAPDAPDETASDTAAPTDAPAPEAEEGDAPATASSGAEGDILLAIRPGSPLDLFKGMVSSFGPFLLGLGVLGLTFLTALTVFIVVLVLRMNSARRIEQGPVA